MSRRTENIPNYRQEIINQVLNFFWTFLCIAPVFWFWVKEGINLYFYSFLGISLMTGAMPRKVLDLLMFGSTRKFYENLGVKYILKFVQNGSLVRMLSNRQSYAVINGKSHARQYLKTISMYERYHWICLLFFVLTAIYGFFHGYSKLAGVITAANVIYNLCPILLQQYNKFRISEIVNLHQSFVKQKTSGN